MDRGAWWATVHGVTKSQTRLKRLIMHACKVESLCPLDLMVALTSLWLPPDRSGRLCLRHSEPRTCALHFPVDPKLSALAGTTPRC